MDVETHTPTSELVAALEQAALIAKQLPTTTIDPSHLLQIHTAHRQLSLYLADHPPPAVDGDAMEMADDEHDNSKVTAPNVDKVEERMRDCFIRNKRPKRPLSPSSVAVEQFENGGGELDPVGSKLRSLDLIYQFHA